MGWPERPKLPILATLAAPGWPPEAPNGSPRGPNGHREVPRPLPEEYSGAPQWRPGGRSNLAFHRDADWGPHVGPNGAAPEGPKGRKRAPRPLPNGSPRPRRLQTGVRGCPWTPLGSPWGVLRSSAANIKRVDVACGWQGRNIKRVDVVVACQNRFQDLSARLIRRPPMASRVAPSLCPRLGRLEGIVTGLLNFNVRL